MNRRFRRVAAGLLVLVLLGAGPGQGADAPPLKVGRGGATVSLETGPGLRRATFLGTTVCLRRTAGVRITGVGLNHPVGAGTVSDYRVVPSGNNMPGAVARPLRSVKQIPRGSHRVRGLCSRRGHAYRVLYVELTKPAASAVAGGTGLRIRYREGGRARVAISVFGLYVCDDVGSEECDTATG